MVAMVILVIMLRFVHTRNGSIVLGSALMVEFKKSRFFDQGVLSTLSLPCSYGLKDNENKRKISQNAGARLSIYGELYQEFIRPTVDKGKN